MKPYITYRRFKGESISGWVNIPAMTECYEENNYIYTMDGKQLCVSSSENAHQFFARNDDKHGLERGTLVYDIQKLLEKRDEKYQFRWDALWDDKLVCGKYKRKEYPDYWLWNHDFFNAPIEDLRYIKKLILDQNSKELPTQK